MKENMQKKRKKELRSRRTPAFYTEAFLAVLIMILGSGPFAHNSVFDPEAVNLLSIWFFGILFFYISGRREWKSLFVTLRSTGSVFKISAGIILFLSGIYRILQAGKISPLEAFIVSAGFGVVMHQFPLSISGRKNNRLPISLSLAMVLFPAAAMDGIYGLSFPSLTILYGLLGLLLVHIVDLSILFGNRWQRDIVRFHDVGRNKFILYALIFTAGIMITLEDPGFKKKSEPVAVLDAWHQKDENLSLRFSTSPDDSFDWGHANLITTLERLGWKTRLYEGPDDELKDASVFISVMPDQIPDNSTVKFIHKRVKEGMGLLMVGDHTNVSGVMKALNPLAEPLGMKLEFDTVWVKSTDRRSLIYSRHHLLKGIKRLNFSVGASINISGEAKPLLLTDFDVFGDKGNEAAYENAFLGNNLLDKDERSGHLPLAAITHFGLGRAMLLGDSAYFQNALYYRNLLFLNRTMNWLNRNNSDIRQYMYILLGILALLILWSIRRTGKSDINNKDKSTAETTEEFEKLENQELLSLITGLLTVLAFSMFIGSILAFGVLDDSAVKQIPGSILVDAAHANEAITYWDVFDHQSYHWDAIFKGIVRMGYIPVIADKPAEKGILKNAKAYITINPSKQHKQSEINNLKSFVDDGGGLMIIDGPRPRSASSNLLKAFGFTLDGSLLGRNAPVMEDNFIKSIGHGWLQSPVVSGPFTFGLQSVNAVYPTIVRGGEPIALFDGEAIVSSTTKGKGTVLVIGDHQFLANGWTETEGNIEDQEKMMFLWNSLYTIAGPPPPQKSILHKEAMSGGEGE